MPVMNEAPPPPVTGARIRLVPEAHAPWRGNLYKDDTFLGIVSRTRNDKYLLSRDIEGEEQEVREFPRLSMLLKHIAEPDEYPGRLIHHPTLMERGYNTSYAPSFRSVAQAYVESAHAISGAYYER